MYKGYIEINQNDDKYMELYNNTSFNIYDCLINQYLIVKGNDGNVIDRLKWNGNKYDHL